MADQGADATPAQAWYREEAEQFGEWTVYFMRQLLGGQNAAREVQRNARYAGHFGNLALGADELEAALAVPPQGWQPIETAPIEGTVVWLAGPEWSEARLGRVTERSGGCRFDRPHYGEAGWIHGKATHWMPQVPLPSPPRVAAGPKEPT